MHADSPSKTLPQTTPKTQGQHPTPPLRILKLSPSATLPIYATSHAAGMDLAACLPDAPIELASGQITLIPCGFAMALPPHHEAQVRPRSGLAVKHGITLINSPGTIDEDYRGEVKVPLINHSKQPFTIEHAMRIAQMVIAPVAHVAAVEVTELDATERGQGGFGSTGT